MIRKNISHKSSGAGFTDEVDVLTLIHG